MAKLQDDAEFYRLETDAVASALQTSQKRGLAIAEVEQRLEQYGPNNLPEVKPKSWIVLVLKQFKDAFVLVMLIGTAIAYGLGETTDALIILAAILINTLTGFFQEAKAQKTFQELKKLVSLKARVLRDNEEQIVHAINLVPGDIIIIEEGDKVPADARLVAALNIETNEAALTGESQSVKKQVGALEEKTPLAERANMIYAGTIITQGHGTAVVTKTGLNTETGKIAGLLKQVKELPSPLQKRLKKFTLRIGIAAALAVVLIFVAGIAAGNDFIEMFKTSVSVAVAAIPEGLLVVVTITLAIGMKRISKRKSVVRHPAAAETLGSTTVICTDKTGTLTEGVMKVDRVHFFNEKGDMQNGENHKNLPDALRVALFCTNTRAGYEEGQKKIIGDPTEAALHEFAENHGLVKLEEEEKQPRIDEVPFDFVSKFMVTVHKTERENIQLYAKGAPEAILKRSTKILVEGESVELTEELRAELLERDKELAAEGHRNLALAIKTMGTPQDDKQKYQEDLTFVGIASLNDPIRLYVEESIAETQKAGIEIVMITGDHALTAKKIASRLGLPASDNNILEGKDLEKMTQEQLQNRVRNISIYARVSPEDKLNIVRAWQAEGEIVAMTGDGVNDTPALKAAEIGIAVGGGTELAKETADIVLLDNNFATIAAAVEEGRVIFDNIKKVFAYILGTNFGEVLVILGSILVGLPLPLLATQIIWVNLVSDGAPNVTLAMEPTEKGVMSRPPRKPNEPIVSRYNLYSILYVGVITGALTLGLFAISLANGDNIDHARTMAFTMLSLITLVAVMSYRSLSVPAWKMNPAGNRYLLIAVAGSLLLQIAAIYLPPLQQVLDTTPLSWGDWLILGVMSLLALFLIELRKFFPQNKENA